jgi:hypothetical protein
MRARDFITVVACGSLVCLLAMTAFLMLLSALFWPALLLAPFSR